MKYDSTTIPGAYLIELDKKEDDRGFFARMFCYKEFEKMGLDTRFIQANNSLSKKKGTLRGLHYQLPPFQETKLVRSIRGSIYDVILDLRKDSPCFGKSFGALLSGENRKMMYVPKGVAHGFISMEDNSEIIYMVSSEYSQEMERGIRWNDPFFNIHWPEMPQVVSERDNGHPNFSETTHL